MLQKRRKAPGPFSCFLTVFISFLCVADDKAVDIGHNALEGRPQQAVPVSATQAMLKPAQAIFANGRNALNIPFKFIGAHIVLPVRIDNSRELNIVLDSGMPVPGLSLTRPELGDELKLSLQDSPIKLSGAGSGALMNIKQSPGHTISLPGVRFEDQRIDVMSQALSGQGDREGIIGNTILESCVVEIDYTRQVIHLYDPGSCDLRDQGNVVPLKVGPGRRGRTVNGVISLDGSDDMQLLLALDLGSGRNLTLFPSARLPFNPPDPQNLQVIGRGIRGEVRGYARPIRRFSFGPVSLQNLETHFQSNEGLPFYQSSGIEGVLGHGALRHFDRVILDYSRNCMVIIERPVPEK